MALFVAGVLAADEARPGAGDISYKVRDMQLPVLNVFPPDGQYDLDAPQYRFLKEMTPEQRRGFEAAYDPDNREYYRLEAEGRFKDPRFKARYCYQRFMKNYLRVVAGIDDNVGKIRAYLDANGLTRNTVFVYASDQGFFMGEHGGRFDKRMMNEEAMRMPLVMQWPGRFKPGRRPTALVQNVDYAPTFLELAGIPIPPEVQGRSFKAILEGRVPDDWRTSVYYHYYDHGNCRVPRHDGVRTERFKLIDFYSDNRQELYDLKYDVHEGINLAAHPDYADVIAKMRTELHRMRKQLDVPQSAFKPPYYNAPGASSAVEAPAGKRRTICLDGTWQVAEGTMDRMPKDFAHTVPVPGLLDMATPGFETPGSVVSDAERGKPWRRPERADPLREAFWYRRTFKVNAPTSNVALLKVNKAFFGTCVFLNGKKVGTNAFNFTPGWFDLGPHIKTDGSENELLIRVGASLAQIPLSVTDGWDYEKTRYVPGIYDSVKLILTSTPHVVNVQTVPDIENGSVRAVIELANMGTQAIAPRVKAMVREAGSGRVCGETVVEPNSLRPMTIRETTNLRPGGKGRMDVTIGIAEPHWWTPEEPFLYELIIDTGADVHKTRFAMRSFKTDPASGRVLLNGQPYYLRGSNVCIFRFSEDPLRGDKMWDRQWVRKLHRQFKNMHWNSLRYCIGFPPEMWYEIADEEGILIQDEFPIWYNHWPEGTMAGWPDQITAESLAKEFTEWMRERWNHPCVVIWDAQNETSSDTVLAEVIGRVRGLDLSNRPWDNGWGTTQSPTDISEYHPYRCSPQFPRPFRLSIFGQESGIPDTGPKQGGHPPRIINEYGWLWLNRDGTPAFISRPVYESIFGPNATTEVLRDYYARTLGAMTEFWRSRRKCAGVMHFCGLGHSRPGGITCDNFADIESLTFEPKFYNYVRDSFAPIGVVVDLWRDQVEPSTRLDVPVSGQVDHWSIWGPGALYHADPGQVMETRAVKFWHSDSGMYQGFGVTPGHEYAFSVEVLNSAARNETLKLWKGYLRAEFYNDTMTLVSSADLDTYDPTTTKTPLERWETLSGTTTAPAGATTGRIVLGLKDYQPGAGGVLQFDNARVVAQGDGR